MKIVIIVLLLILQSFLIQWFNNGKNIANAGLENNINEESNTWSNNVTSNKVILSTAINDITLSTNKTQNSYKLDIAKVDDKIIEQKKIENKKIQDDWLKFRKDNGWLYKYLRKNINLSEKKELQDNLENQKIIVKDYLQDKRSINNVRDEIYKNNKFIQERLLKDYITYMDRKIDLLIEQKSRIAKIRKEAEDSYLKVQFAILNQANNISEKAKGDIKNVVNNISPSERNDVIDVLINTIKSDEKKNNTALSKEILALLGDLKIK